MYLFGYNFSPIGIISYARGYNIIYVYKYNYLGYNMYSMTVHAVARMGEERGCIGSWWGNRREGDHWADLGVDGWIILG